jgi:hypothetical protein
MPSKPTAGKQVDRASPCRATLVGARRYSVSLVCVVAALSFGFAELTLSAIPLLVLSKTFATGGRPRWLALEDVNGDRKPDVLTVNQGGETVSVLMNTGDSFSRRRDYRTGGLPLSGAISDLDGDGAADVAVANLGRPDKVSVLLNRGDGTFRAPVDYRAGDYPTSIAADDLNGDDKPDLAVANGGSGTVSVLMNRGDGTFEIKRDYAAGLAIVATAIADMNGDGRNDVVTLNLDTFSVLVNNGDGSFRRGFDHRTDEHSESLAIADVNGDHRPDVAIASRPSTVSVFLSRSGGNVWSRRDYRVPAPAAPALAIGDLNGDDKPELVVPTARIPGTISVLTNTGEGRFRDRRDYGRGDYPVAVAIADVNHDGKLDVATVNFGSSTVSVFRNRTGERVQICTVPSVRGSTLAAAKKEIAQAHCRVGQISSEPYRAPAGRVVVESPPAGTRMRSGGRVDLVVSRKLRPRSGATKSILEPSGSSCRGGQVRPG